MVVSSTTFPHKDIHKQTWTNKELDRPCYTGGLKDASWMFGA